MLFSGQANIMIWNHLIHIIAGIIGYQIFTWSKSGLLICALITAGVQAIDIFRIYFYHKNLILASPLTVKEEKMRVFKDRAFYIFSQLYIWKVIWYGSVTILAAAITRHFLA